MLSAFNKCIVLSWQQLQYNNITLSVLICWTLQLFNKKIEENCYKFKHGLVNYKKSSEYCLCTQICHNVIYIFFLSLFIITFF